MLCSNGCSLKMTGVLSNRPRRLTNPQILLGKMPSSPQSMSAQSRQTWPQNLFWPQNICPWRLCIVRKGMLGRCSFTAFYSSAMNEMSPVSSFVSPLSCDLVVNETMFSRVVLSNETVSWAPPIGIFSVGGGCLGR